MQNHLSPGYVRNLCAQAIEECIEDLPETDPRNFEYILPSTALLYIQCQQVKIHQPKLSNHQPPQHTEELVHGISTIPLQQLRSISKGIRGSK
jgi:hypothetical protein